MLSGFYEASREFARLTASACRFVRREPSSTLLLLRMAWWVAALSLLLRFTSLPRVLSLMQPRRRPTRAASAAEAQARLGRLIDALLGRDFLCFTPTCWKRAPVLHRFLALEGIETRILFGVRKGETELLAGHAWLEANGKPLLENSRPDYTVTYSFPVEHSRTA